MFNVCHVTPCLKGYVNFWVEVPHGRFLSCNIWWSSVWCKWLDKVFNLSCDLKMRRNRRIVYSQHLGRFVDLKHCDSGDVTLLICHAIPKYHETKEPWLYWSWPLMVSYHRAKFGSHWHCDSGDMNILANTVIIPQMQYSRFVEYPWSFMLTSTIFIFTKAHGMTYTTRITNSSLKNNFYANLF